MLHQGASAKFKDQGNFPDGGVFKEESGLE